MIQINLVPDVKQEMLRAQRMRNFTISMAIVVGLVAAGVVVILGLVYGAQVAVEKITESSIDGEYKKLKDTKDINQALTIQNQLNSISSISDKKSMNSRLLDVIAAINPPAPNDVKLSNVTVDPKERKITLEGSAAGGYTATDIFRKTILNTKISFTRGGTTDEETVPLTEEATLQDTSFGEDVTGQKVVRFTMVFTYPDGMLDNTLAHVRITTPVAQIDVTDSKTRVPDSMFSTKASDAKGDS